jgi:hypothetical protein
MLYRDIMAVCSEIHTKHINTLCGQDVELLSGKLVVVTLTPHPFLVPWSSKGRAIPLLPLWAERPLQCLRACTGCTLTSTNLASYIKDRRTATHQMLHFIYLFSTNIST